MTIYRSNSIFNRANLSNSIFNWADLDGITLDIHVYQEDGIVTVAGRDVKTGKVYILSQYSVQS